MRGKKGKPASKPSQRARGRVSDRPRRKSSNDGKLARALADAAEARAHQAATAEILSVISSSPTEVQPVFDAIAKSAARLFGTWNAGVLIREGDMIHVRAVEGLDPKNVAKVEKMFPMPFDPSSILAARAIADGRFLEVPDTESVEVPSRARDLARAGGWRAVAFVPLLRDGRGIGAIAMISRNPASRFTERQVSLLRTFADQGVIAIENVRAFHETREALSEQKASGEVLAAIAGSMSDTAPVFDRILESCERLFAGHYAGINVIGEDGLVHLAAYRGPNPEGYARVFPMPNNSESATAIVIATRKVLHYPDLEAPGLPRGPRESARTTGARSAIMAPLLTEKGGIGSIYVSRRTPAPFSEREIARLEAFANQATIAIENARLFNETKEALERQTATAEILKVIASSPSDVQPVFDAIAESGARLFRCGAGIVIREGEWLNLKAAKSAVVDPATMKQRFEELRKIYPLPFDPERSPASRAIASREIVEVSDYEAPDLIEAARESGRRGGFRSSAQAPMVREGEGIGMIALLFEQPGVRLNEQQRALLTTFADQAVIAIENVRLFNETKEALERQTATAEILKVISESPTDVQPVFDAIAKSAARLIGVGARLGIVIREGDHVDIKAIATKDDLDADRTRQMLDAMKKHYPRPYDPERHLGSKVMESRVPLEVDDTEAPGVLELVRELARSGGYRSIAMVPLLREGVGIGLIAVSFEQPGMRLNDNQRALLTTFADQAVIAIENVRLFNETKEALERQTATTEILKVIASSPDDVQPVFEAIVASAMRLMKGATAHVTRLEGGTLHLLAYSQTDAAGAAALKRVYPRNVAGTDVAEVLETRVPRVISDAEMDPHIEEEVRAAMRARGVRGSVVVPLVSKGDSVGTLVVNRRDAGGFSDHEIGLLQTFADQAVIAIENVRLFNETNEALERQTATAEILKVISASHSDVTPVLDAVVERAARICESDDAVLFVLEADRFRQRARFRLALHVPESHQNRQVGLDRSTIMGAAVLDRQPIQIEDLQSLPDGVYEEGRRLARELNQRATLAVPLLRDDAALGALLLRRIEARPFTDKQISLLRTFADQAAIGIENVRLFNETKEALERQTATAEILKVISESPTDEQPVLDAIAESASRLFGCYAAVLMRDGDYVYLNTMVNAPAGVDRINIEEMQKLYPLPFDPEHNITSRTIATCSIVEVTDTQGPEQPEALKQVSARGGYRSVTLVPLVREGAGIGCIGLAIVRPGFKLNDKQRALLRTFADQAVIAIENVRLFKELRVRTEALTKSVGQLTALGEVGQAISSTLDLDKVLPTIVSRAVQLTGLDGGAIYEYDEHLQVFNLRGGENIMPELVELYRSQPIRLGEGAVGGAAATREPVQIADIVEQGYESRARGVLERAGARALLAVPLLAEGRILGALAVIRNAPGEFPPEVVKLLQTFGTQSAIAIQNARLFREIEEKSRQLEEASHHKSQFLASMSHELRTPLNAILGFNEMMLDGLCGEVPEGFTDPLQEMQTSGKHLLRLINNVLDLAKIEAGRMELALADYAVNDMVEGVRSTLRPLAEAKGLEFRVDGPADLPLAHGDAGRLTQCLMNLAGNSLKFTKEGHVAISVEPKGENLVFRVTDTGIGIAPEKIDSLFTEFKQTDATIASEYGGTGLGLAITRQFIEMHGGRIWVESEPGKGSTFIFEVPLRAKAV